MHMSDALLSPAVGGTMWAGTLAAIAYCSKKTKEDFDEKKVPLMGVLGAFVFAAQMINFSIPGTGSSGHLVGGMILAVVLGPYQAFIVMASVVTVQAFFFGDGGLLALGCNIWNLGFYPCFVALPFIYKPLLGRRGTRTGIVAASLAGGIAALQLGAFSVVLETVLSGRSELSFSAFVLLMQPIHLAIGVVEGLVTAGVVNFVKTARPELLESTAGFKPMAPGVRVRKIGLTFLVAALLLGGVVSWFASSNPEGLEWAVAKVYGKPGPTEAKGTVASALKAFQEKTAFLPDYNFKKGSEGERKAAPDRQATEGPPKGGSSLSGVLGVAMMMALIALVGLVIRIFRRRGPERRAA